MRRRSGRNRAIGTRALMLVPLEPTRAGRAVRVCGGAVAARRAGLVADLSAQTGAGQSVPMSTASAVFFCDFIAT